jgi:lipopolysaccharide biosynthesis glycosyltransferase
MKWFSGVNSHNEKLYNNYIKMYKVAVVTAKQTNPNIQPYLILDGEIDESITELINLGVQIIKHKVSFSDALIEHYKDNTIALGAFLRVDIPKICNNLNIEDDYILYTDNDVMFINDVTSLNELNPKYFMCAGEFTKEFTPMGMNSGVMWINWKNMFNDYEKFVIFIKINLSKFQVYDQDALKLFYSNRMESFDSNFNYKPYWEESEDIKILHFHGPKPTFTNDDLKLFPYPSLITPYYEKMTKKFNQIYDNNNLLNT